MTTVSIKDVARLANVSSATVSRAMNSPDRVDMETLARIQGAIRKLGYVPSGAARSLRTQRSQTIGMCIPTLAFAVFGETVSTIQRELNQAGLTLLLSVTGFDVDQELADVSAMVQRGIDGLVLIGGVHHPELIEMVRARGLPYVVVWSVHDDHPSVGFDHRRAMLKVGMHLLDLGHRRLGAIVTSVTRNDRVRDRLAGIRDAMSIRGLALPEASVVATETGLKAGRQAMAQLLDLPEQPTAVACVNDVLAAGALMEARARGLRVPEDVSISGFYEMEIGAEQTPPITTVRTPINAMGRRAARLLIDQSLNGLGKERTTDMREELETELIVRASTGPASN